MPVPALVLAACLAAPPADADRRVLAAAGVAADDPAAVLGYLRKRTLGPAELDRLRAAVARLGAEAFADREAASQAVVGFGPAAGGLLRQAVQQNPDPEVQHRASECLRELGQVPHAAAAAAAARAAGRLAPPEAAGVLLGFLPLADDRTVAAEVRAALARLAVRDGVPDPAVVAALTDANPQRRAAAAVALAAGEGPGKPPRAPDLLPRVLAAATAEPDPAARFQMLFALAADARQKAAVAPLIELLPKMSRGRQWQVEDLLLQLAGPAAPPARLGRYATPGDPAVGDWLRWWEGAADALDLAAAKYAPRTTGGLMLVSVTPRQDATYVAEVGPDGDDRWRLPPYRAQADVRPLPDGLVHVAERSPAGHRLTVLDPAAGRPVRVRTFPAPAAPNRLDVAYTQAHPLPGGGVLLVGPGEVAEFPANNDQPVFRYSRQQKMDVATACRLGDGRTLVLVKGGPPHGLLLDAAGKEQPGRTVRVANPQFYPFLQATAVGGNRVLLAEPGRLAEYEADGGKLVWQKPITDAGGLARAVSGTVYGVQRLANGNTLYVEAGRGGADGSRVVEVTPDGDEVWAYRPAGPLTLFRAYQR